MVLDMTQTTTTPLPPLTVIPDDLRNLADYAQRASQHLAPHVWRHIEEGAGSEITLRDNRNAFDRIGFLPRVMADLNGHTQVELFGKIHASPIMLAPMAFLRLAHSEGELAAVRAATALNAGMVVSTLASTPLEDIAAAAQSLAYELGGSSAPLWFQLYLQPRREDSLKLIRRAEAARYEAIVLTIDAALKPAGITLPEGVEAANLTGMARIQQTSVPGGSILLGTPLTDAAPTWADLAWLRAQTQLPILVKGMIVHDDARRAVDEGANGLIISNHGGRVLDGLPSALDMIQSVADTTQNRVPLLLDGGIRSGSDVAKALALGAKAVLIGRPQMHALAVAGMPGLAHALHILRTELEMTMAQLGCPTVTELTAERLIAFPG